jgi:hypothetical protein
MVKVSGETSKHRCGGKMTKKYRQAGGFTPEQCAQKCAEDDQCQYVSLAQNKYCNVYAKCEPLKKKGWDWLNWKKVTTTVSADLGGDGCFEANTNYRLGDLDDLRRELMEEAHTGLLACQRACARHDECTHFTYRPDAFCDMHKNDGCFGCCDCGGACYVKRYAGEGEPPKNEVKGLVSGPKRCPVRTN